MLRTDGGQHITRARSGAAGGGENLHCAICLVNHPTHAVLPCCHISYCGTCQSRVGPGRGLMLERCAICRKNITRVLNVQGANSAPSVIEELRTEHAAHRQKEAAENPGKPRVPESEVILAHDWRHRFREFMEASQHTTNVFMVRVTGKESEVIPRAATVGKDKDHKIKRLLHDPFRGSVFEKLPIQLEVQNIQPNSTS